MPTATETGERLVEAIAARDFERIEACLAPDVRFRALVPSALREYGTAGEAIERMRLWWAELEGFELLESEVEEMADRVRVAYRLRGRDPEEGRVVVEQQAYVAVEDGRITALNLVCSGFRPDGTR